MCPPDARAASPRTGAPPPARSRLALQALSDPPAPARPLVMVTLSPVSLVRELLASLDLDPSTGRPLGTGAVWPLGVRGPDRPASGAVHLADALPRGLVEVRELDPPEVARLLVRNVGDVAVFLPAGTLLRGGGQNRIVAVSALLMPGEERTVDVRCVEAGRWNPQHEERFAATASAPLSLKSGKARRDSEARLSGRQRAEDQGDTWRDVSRVLAEARVDSRTDSLFDAVDRAAKVHRAPPPELRGAAGALVASGSTATLEVFPDPGLRGAGLRTLLESARLDTPAGQARLFTPEPAAFVAAREDVLDSPRWTVRPAHGGVLVDFAGTHTGATGCAFVADGTVLHLEMHLAAG